MTKKKQKQKFLTVKEYREIKKQIYILQTKEEFLSSRLDEVETEIYSIKRNPLKRLFSFAVTKEDILKSSILIASIIYIYSQISNLIK